MAGPRDVVIIGGGHNGLVAAFYLARAGLRPLVLEQRDRVGGAATTEEFHPGFRCSTFAHVTGPLHPRAMSDMALERYGLDLIRPGVKVCALPRTGRPLCIYADAERTSAELRDFSTADAQRYLEFQNSFASIGRVLAPLLAMTPPAIDDPGAGDLWHFGKLGLAFHRLPRKDAYRLLRWGPMAVADLAAEWFDTESLQAVIASRGVYGAFAGPMSAGTSAALLLQAALDGDAIGSTVFVKCGMGSLANALASAASDAGAEIRTGAKVAAVTVREGRATGVVLSGGEEIPARAFVSNLDPRHTLLGLVEATELDPNFLEKIRNYRCLGSGAKLNLALARLPEFKALGPLAHAMEKLSGRILIGPDIEYLERAFDAAKYGDYSPRPFLDFTIPSIVDPSLAPEGKHVMSVYVQYAPYELRRGNWIDRRDEFGDMVVDLLSEYAPNLKDLIISRQIITPLDLEHVLGMTGGHIMHGEHSLDQLFAFRPLIGWAQYRTPITGLYLCGAGTHPGGGITGAPGANASREIIKDLKANRRS